MLPLRHGYNRGGQRRPEYGVWAGMWTRCTNPNAVNYHLYGGRGVTVCERWRDFANFITDMGDRPSKDYSIDRIKNHVGYEPGNCRWATRSEQNKNRRPFPRKPTTIGEDRPKAILTEQDVRTIRASAETIAALARRYKVSTATMSKAKNGLTWRHVR